MTTKLFTKGSEAKSVCLSPKPNICEQEAPFDTQDDDIQHNNK